MLHGHLRVEDGVPVIEFLEQADYLAAVACVLDTKQRVVETVQMHTVDEPAGQVRHLPIAACGFQHVGLDQLAAGVRMIDVGRARHGMPLQVVDELSPARQPRQVADVIGHGRQRRPCFAPPPAPGAQLPSASKLYPSTAIIVAVLVICIYTAPSQRQMDCQSNHGGS